MYALCVIVSADRLHNFKVGVSNSNSGIAYDESTFITAAFVQGPLDLGEARTIEFQKPIYG